MNSSLIAYPIALVLFVAIDMVWLMGPGRPFYQAEIGTLLRADPIMPAAFAFYLLYAAGLVYFGVSAGLASNSVLQASIAGAIFGLMAYGTYDLTNLAVLKGFTAKIAIIDLAWGTFLTGLVSAATVKVMQMFG